MLSRSINTAVDYNTWKPIILHKQEPPIFHLFFADDIILASKIDKTSCHCIIDHINHFNTFSGQKINYTKSCVFFSNNCSQQDRDFVLTFLNIPQGHSFGKYLGFSILTKQPTKRDYQFIIDNFKNRLACWKTKTLTLAGRTTLIKSTLNSIPNHVMQLLPIPAHIIKQLEKYKRNFLWGTTPHRKKLHLIRWVVVTKTRNEGA